MFITFIRIIHQTTDSINECFPCTQRSTWKNFSRRDENFPRRNERQTQEGYTEYPSTDRETIAAIAANCRANRLESTVSTHEAKFFSCDGRESKLSTFYLISR